MSIVIGWDIGGAHLKAARARDGVVDAVAQLPTPLWKGLDSLEDAFATLRDRLGPADVNAVTMTGELCDAFASRREGVVGLASLAARRLAPGAIRLFAGAAGFVGLDEAAARASEIASANWLASAQWTARRLGDALFVDIGSTTADLIPISAGRVAAVAATDADRLAAGELVYVGLTRSFVMALASRAPFAGAWTSLMAEYFANSADVHRVLGTLPDGADLMDTADGREKTVEASRARLARMIGREAADADPAAWETLAGWFAECQIRAVTDGAYLRLSRGDLARLAPVVCAGVGADLAGEVARRLGRPRLAFESLLPASADAALGGSQCAPAAALSLLAG